MGREMLRGVYTERSQGAQHDSAMAPTDGQIVLLKVISGSPDKEEHYEYKDE